MADQPPRIAIGRMSVRGVDPGTARALGPALQSALAEAACSRLRAGSARNLQLRLPAGATAAEIAAALARALGEGR
jgi:hypothetical protein